MSGYNDDPNLGLITLEKIAEEIPLGISAQDIAETVNQVTGCSDISDSFNQIIATDLKNGLRSFWEAYKVNELLAKVKDLDCSKNENIGHDHSKQDLINAVQVKYLTRYKVQLEEKLKEIEKENENLEQSLKVKVDLFNKHLEKVPKFNFK